MADIAAEARPATSEAHVHWAGVTEPRDSSATTYRDAIDHETYWLNVRPISARLLRSCTLMTSCSYMYARPRRPAQTICPLGGAHDWMRHGDPIDNWSAAAATGVAGALEHAHAPRSLARIVRARVSQVTRELHLRRCNHAPYPPCFRRHLCAHLLLAAPVLLAARVRRQPRRVKSAL